MRGGRYSSTVAGRVEGATGSRGVAVHVGLHALGRFGNPSASLDYAALTGGDRRSISVWSATIVEKS